MKQYTTTKVIWRKGLEVEVGTPLTLSDEEAKYLKHALTEVKDEAAPKALPLFEVEEPAAVAPLALAVDEQPADPSADRKGRHHRQKH